MTEIVPKSSPSFAFFPLVVVSLFFFFACFCSHVWGGCSASVSFWFFLSSPWLVFSASRRQHNFHATEYQVLPELCRQSPR